MYVHASRLNDVINKMPSDLFFQLRSVVTVLSTYIYVDNKTELNYISSHTRKKGLPKRQAEEANQPPQVCVFVVCCIFDRLHPIPYH